MQVAVNSAGRPTGSYDTVAGVGQACSRALAVMTRRTSFGRLRKSPRASPFAYWLPVSGAIPGACVEAIEILCSQAY